MKLKKIVRNQYIEVIILFIILVGVMNYFNPTDPLLFSSQFNIYFYGLLSVSLFYGFFSGTLFLALFFGFEYWFYHHLNLQNLYQYFIIMLIVSEFFYVWTNKIAKLEEKNQYLNHRLEEVGIAYYLLKLSHDEIEQNYILKPFSIRNVLSQIKSLMTKNKKEAMNTFLLLLERIFKIEQATLYLFDNGNDTFELMDYIGIETELDMKDPLVQIVLQKKELVFIDMIDNNEQSQYLAILPLISLNSEIKGLFLIKEMPFFNLNKDNLLMISLFLSYFINSYYKTEKYKKYNFDEDFLNEIDKLLFLNKKYKIKSYLVVFKSKYEMQFLEIQKRLRGTDIGYQKDDKLMILFPFMSVIGVNDFISRIQNVKGVKYKVIALSKLSLDEVLKEMDNE